MSVILLTASIIGRRIKMRGPFLPCCGKCVSTMTRGFGINDGVDLWEEEGWVWIRHRGGFGEDTISFPLYSLLVFSFTKCLHPL